MIDIWLRLLVFICEIVKQATMVIARNLCKVEDEEISESLEKCYKNITPRAWNCRVNHRPPRKDYPRLQFLLAGDSIIKESL